MKLFSIFLAAVFISLLSVIGTMAQTSDQVISAIQSFTTAVETLSAEASALNSVNFLTTCFLFVNGLGNLTSEISTFNAEFSPSTPPYPDDVAIVVLDALTTFVDAYQDLLNVIIGKHSLAAMFGFIAPIAASLRASESVVNTFVLTVINLIPTEAGPANAEFLSATFQSAIGTYGSM